MEKKDLGNLLVIEGLIVFISSTLFWVIAIRTFEIYTYTFYFGLFGLSGTLAFFFVIAGIIVKETKGKKDIIGQKKYIVFGMIYIIFGIYIFLLIVLVDSPIGPPILGPSNINVNYGGWPQILYLMGLPEFVLVLSGIGLLVNKARMWLVIGFLTLMISMTVLQLWFMQINMVYEWF